MTRTRILVLLAVVVSALIAFAFLRPAAAPPATPNAPRVRTPEPARARPRAGPVHFGIAAPADDRTASEPCTKIPGAGLYSLAAFFDRAAGHLTPFVRIHLGDLTHATGDLGANLATARCEILATARTIVVAPGPGELALGTEFSRRRLTAMSFGSVCANVTDAGGAAFLKPWALLDAEGRTVLLVGSVSPSLQEELARAGSDVRITDPRAAIETALASGRADAQHNEREIAATVLLHHGTLEETKALVRDVPWVTFAVAARGRDLPDAYPDRSGGVPVFESGRGGRFGWIVTVDDGRAAMWQFERIGVGILSASSPSADAAEGESHFVREGFFARVALGEDVRTPDPRGEYVGAKKCASCHAQQFADHEDSVHARLPLGFPETGQGSVQCLSCHATGAVWRTGWKGPKDTSDLAAVSCEACHGPGAAHAADPKPGWGASGLARCRTCHTPDRAPDFDAEALWKKSGHKSR